MNADRLLACAAQVGENAYADIWYDAADHGDTGTSEQISATQEAMAALAGELPDMVQAIREAEQALATHPEANVGNSKVHYALCRMRAALNGRH